MHTSTLLVTATVGMLSSIVAAETYTVTGLHLTKPNDAARTLDDICFTVTNSGGETATCELTNGNIPTGAQPCNNLNVSFSLMPAEGTNQFTLAVFETGFSGPILP